jgi:ATP-binding cassette, subfamily B, bacterial RamB/AmfA
MRMNTVATRRLLVLSVVEAAPDLAAGWVTAAALDRGFLAGRPGVGVGWLGVLAALYLVRAAATRATFGPLATIVESLRDGLTRRVVYNALHQGADGTGGTVSVARLTGQIDSVRDLAAALLRTARPLAVGLVAAIAGLAGLSPLLALLVAAPLTVALVLFTVLNRRLTALRRETVLAGETVAARAGEMLTAARDITALGAQEAAEDLVGAATELARRALERVGRAAAWRVPVVLVGGYLPLLALLIAGPHLPITPGRVVGAATYLVGSLLPALQLLTSTVGGYWSQLRVGLARLAETAPLPVPLDDPAPAGAVPADRLTGDLTTDELTFSYGAGAEPVLRGLSLRVAYGEHVAITGASGIGKSTLAMLLAGVREPTAGVVRLAGCPAAECRELVALVPQEAYVFPGTVRDNLRYLAPAATDEALTEAATAVGAAALVARLGGFSAVLDDPATDLSGGERQLLALTRTYLAAAPLIILDEATSQLDPAAERTAETAFRHRPGTLLVIAHRPGSADRADRVIELTGVS